MNYIFGGKKFKQTKDFENDFKPTHWSIRKYRDFIITLSLNDRKQFIDYTIMKLAESYNDRMTSEFIEKIRFKNETNSWYVRESRTLADSGHSIINETFIYEFLVTMVMMKKNGIIECSGKELADILKSQFGLSLSLTTIRDKIYRIEADLNQNLISNLDEIMRKVYKY